MELRPGLRAFVFTGIVAVVGLACGQTLAPTPVPSQPVAPAASEAAHTAGTPAATNVSDLTPTAVPPAPVSAQSTPTPVRAMPIESGSTSPDEIRSEIINFTLEDLVVSVGTTVIWENFDSAPHTATSGDSPRPSGQWGSALLQQGGVFQFTFDQPGSYSYFCTIHPNMVATVTVTETDTMAREAPSPTATSVPVPAATPTPAASPTATVLPTPTATPISEVATASTPVSRSGTDDYGYEAPAATATPVASPAPASPPTATPAVPTATATPPPATPSPPVPPTPIASAPPVRSSIVDFTLEDLVVSVGTSIIWENVDAAPHTSTAGVSPVASGAWDSRILNTGQSFQFTFNEPGQYPYFCTVHPFMVATVVVEN